MSLIGVPVLGEDRRDGLDHLGNVQVHETRREDPCFELIPVAKLVRGDTGVSDPDPAHAYERTVAAKGATEELPFGLGFPKGIGGDPTKHDRVLGGAVREPVGVVRHL